MHYEYIGALEVTYGNALAAGGGFHRVTTAEGSAAEVTPHTYLWYKLTPSASNSSNSISLSASSSSNSSSASSSASARLSTTAASGSRKQLSLGSSAASAAAPSSASDSSETARGITQLRIELEDWTPPPSASLQSAESDTTAPSSSESASSARDASRRSSSRTSDGASSTWTKMDKPIDRQRGLFVWYQSVDWQGPPSPSSSSSSSSSSTARLHEPNYPLKEIRVVRDVKDVPEGFECLSDPIVTSATADNSSTYAALLLVRVVCYNLHH